MNKEENLLQEVNMERVLSDYKRAFAYAERFQTKFPDLDKIVDGVPLKTERGAPYIADASIISLVRKIPRRALQQMPVFSAVANGAKNSEAAYFYNFLLRDRVFNQKAFGRGVLATLQIATQQALTRGYSALMPELSNLQGEFGSTMRILHYQDVANEPGIQEDCDSTYFYVRVEITKDRLDKIIKTIENSDGSSTWDLEALKELQNQAPQGRNYHKQSTGSQSIEDGDENYVLITRYGVGPYEPIITFCEQIENKPLRAFRSNSKFGYPRVQYLVIDPHADSPYGQSRVELASPTIALATTHKQLAYNTMLLNQHPPLLQKGNFITPVALRQGGIIRTNDPNADLKMLNLDNGSLDRYVNVQSQLQAETQSIIGTPTGTLNGGSNTYEYSKTAPGVKLQQADQDIANNQITNLLENFLRQFGLTALDLLLSEKALTAGIEEVVVDDDCRNAINALYPEDVIGDDNIYKIDWKNTYAGLKKLEVEIELSVSPDEMEEKKRKDLQDLATVLGQNSESIPGAAEKVAKISDTMIKEIAPDIANKSDREEYRMPSVETQSESMVE